MPHANAVEDLNKMGVVELGERIGQFAREQERDLTRSLAVFGDRGIRNVEDFRLLRLMIRLHPRPTTASEASTIVGLSKAATALRIERFESDGIVERAIRQFDRRTIEVRVTETGEALAAECVDIVYEVYSRSLKDLNGVEREHLSGFLQKIDTPRFIG